MSARRPAVALGGDAGGQRLGGVAGGDGHIAVRRDPHRQFRIDQIEALRAQLRPSAARCRTTAPRPSARWPRSTWSRSRTMMSRMRTAIPTRPARSICVPPTSTVLPWPILSSIAAASHGVARSRLIGPAPSRHHSPPKQPVKITDQHARAPIAMRLTQRSPVSQSLQPQQKSGSEPVQVWSWNATAVAAHGCPPPHPAPDPSRPSSSHCEKSASARGFDPCGDVFLAIAFSVLTAEA